MSARRLAPLLVLVLCGACGSSTHGDDADDDDDSSADGDADGDGDDPRPPCPEGDDLVIADPCTSQDECDPPLCGRQGGVCIEETWTCGRCDYCFFTRTPHVEDTTLQCVPETGRCS